MRKYMGYFSSSNGINRVAYYISAPDSNPKCIVQIAHGMCENAMLYKRFMHFLTVRGCVVCGNDFLGHGRSVRDCDDAGFFAPQNGWRCIIRDMKKLTDIVSEKYKGLPVILIGHSMGSFAAREYLTWYGDALAGCILVGTSDGFEITKPLKLLAQGLCVYEKGQYHVPLVLKAGCSIFSTRTLHASFGRGALNFLGKDIDWEWLTRDGEVQELIRRHAFNYTARAYYDIVTLLDVVNANDWAYSVPADLPLLLMSGNCDAVGDCGRGVGRLYKRLCNAGCEKVRVRLYSGARHMLLHEINRAQVYRDIYKWISDVLKEKGKEDEKAVS